MKQAILIFACSLMFAGCGARHSQSASSVGFTGGATQEEVFHQLAQMHATLLTNTPGLVRAEFKPAESKRPMQVELAFRDGKLAGVNYIPQ
jgi:hypothetical protein